MSELKRTLAAVFAACAVFLTMFFGLRWELLPSALFGIGIYAGVYLILKPRRRIGGVDVGEIKGGEELARLLEEAGKDLYTIKRAAGEIRDPEVKKNAEKLYGTGERILTYLQKNPEKISMARRFFTYYLDTAAGLLDPYAQF